MDTDRTTEEIHDPLPDHDGGARLVLAVGTTVLPDDGHIVTRLDRSVTRIGSAADCDLVLEGLDALHAEVRHDDRDEFVLVAHGPHVRVHGSEDEPGLLRSGARVELGRWELVYYRG